jgi:hypothetical protein
MKKKAREKSAVNIAQLGALLAFLFGVFHCIVRSLTPGYKRAQDNSFNRFGTR